MWDRHSEEPAGFAPKPKTSPLITLITLIYADQEKSFDFVCAAPTALGNTNTLAHGLAVG